MSALVHTGRSIYFEGNDDKQPDWFCGRCGRILAVRIAPGQIRNLWLACPKCSWLNGFDIDLGWAKYVVEELEARRLSLERLEQLLDDLKDESVTTEEFLDRNPDVAGPIAWLARISLPTLVAILTLIYMVYSGERSARLAEEQTKLAKEQQRVARSDPEVMTPQDVERIARRLHELQEAVQVKPPPKPPRGQSRR